MAHEARRRGVEAATFVVVLVAITLAFGASTLPFVGAVLWSVVFAIVFLPVFDRLAARMPTRPGSAAGLTLLGIAAAVVVPALFLGAYLLDQGAALFLRIQSGQVDVGALFGQLQAGLPDWLTSLLDRAGISDLASLRDKLTAGLTARAQSLAGTAVTLGQGLASFVLSLAVMLYLTFFLLRDGRAINAGVGGAVPLAPAVRHRLARRFVDVVRATVKGGVVVAIAQGALGGVVMAILGVPNALLWAVVMAFSSLLPAVGTALVWIPVSLYLVAVGDTWQAIAMALSGALLIGSVDNVLRPILVGRSTQIPDFVVLITTLGGLQTFGFNGLLIGPVSAALFMSAWQILGEDGADAVASPQTAVAPTSPRSATPPSPDADETQRS